MQSSSQIINNKPTPNLLQAGCPSCRSTNSVKALNENYLLIYLFTYLPTYFYCVLSVMLLTMQTNTQWHCVGNNGVSYENCKLSKYASAERARVYLHTVCFGLRQPNGESETRNNVTSGWDSEMCGSLNFDSASVRGF